MGTLERLPIPVDQGEADDFLRQQLRPELLEAACPAAVYPLTLRRHVGYDHSDCFIASFMRNHLAFHARALPVYWSYQSAIASDRGHPISPKKRIWVRVPI
jgi:S-formylglutathione hydrolase FrmB